MKYISFKIAISNDLSDRLNSMTSYYGQKSQIIRRGIALALDEMEEHQRILKEKTIEVKPIPCGGKCDGTSTGHRG